MPASYSLHAGLASFCAHSDFDHRVMAILGPDVIRRAFDGDVQRERVYHSVALFLTFLSQLLHRCSCEEAVARGTLGGWLTKDACPHNSAYCNARLRLSESALAQLMLQSGRQLAACTRLAEFLRPIRVVDGSSTQLADTKDNQMAYPQPSAQTAGCGFPVLGFVGLMDLDTGAMLDLAHGDLKTNERTLFRRLWDRLAPGDIVLADRGFDAYADSALLQQRGIDTIFRLHSHRKIDLSAAHRAGPGEWLVDLPAPTCPPDWIGHQVLPATLRVRIVEFNAPRSCRVRGPVRLVTTLLDRKRYPKSRLKAIYRRRWDMELNLRHIKTTLGLELLQAKSPAMCRKHLYMGLLAYNLIRHLMWSAAQAADVRPNRISFKAAWTRLTLWLEAPLARRKYLLERSLTHLHQLLVPDRPNRREPHRIKRRPKHYGLLYHSRSESRQWEVTHGSR